MMSNPLQNMDEIHFWENRPFSGGMPEPIRAKTDIKQSMKKKVKRNRTAFTTKQLRALELLFTQNKYITTDRRRDISKALNLGDKSVKIWFQNRRMKEKRESSESSRVESDSSNETSCDMSPPPVTAELYNLNQNKVIVKEKCTPDTCQYQVPNFYANNINEQQFQNVPASDYAASQTNDMQFYYDNNLYPTQYYPFNGGHYINDYNYYQYQQENAMHNNYWNSNDCAPCYYYNEGI